MYGTKQIVSKSKVYEVDVHALVKKECTGCLYKKGGIRIFKYFMLFLLFDEFSGKILISPENLHQPGRFAHN